MTSHVGGAAQRRGCEIAIRPWKVPIVNVADAVVTFTLLILLGHAEQGTNSASQFSNVLSMLLLGYNYANYAMLCCIFLATLGCL